MKTLRIVVLTVLLSTSAMAAGPESFEQLVCEGQTALDTMRPQYARALFDKAAALAPDKADSLAFDRAWTYVETGWLAFDVDEYVTAAERFDKAAMTCPEVTSAISEMWAFSRIERFWKLADDAETADSQADWRAAAAYAARTVKIVPKWPEAHYALGYAYDWTEQTDKAKSEYSKAAPDKSKGAALKALRTAAYNASGRPRGVKMPVYPLLRRCDPGDFQVYKEGQFTVRHHNLELAQRTVRAMRYYMAQPVLGGFLDKMINLPAGCSVWIYRNRKEFADATGLGFAEGAAAPPRFITADNVAGICLHQETPLMLIDVAPHELGHMRFHTMWLTNAGVSSWIDEGIAVSAEPAAYVECRCREFRDAGARGKLPPVRSVFGATVMKTVSATNRAYAESFAMVNALVALGGPRHFAGFVDALHRMDDVAALKMSYGMTPEGLQKLALEWASKQVPDAPVQAIASAMKGAVSRSGDGEIDEPAPPETSKTAARAGQKKAVKAPAGKTAAKGS
jgi:tetratricopeptide (TPR) repeat protein